MIYDYLRVKRDMNEASMNTSMTFKFLKKVLPTVVAQASAS